MSFSPPVAPTPIPFQAQTISTNQQNVPLPFFGGQRLIAIRWITPALNKVTTQVQGAGKKG